MKNTKQIELVIPTELHEVTLDMYQKLRALDENDEELEAKIISIMCNLNMEVVKGLPVKEFRDISNTLQHTLNKKEKHVQKFWLNGTEYGFIPNFDDISIGEYIDIDKYIRDEDDLNKLMSVLYRPITEQSFGKYRIEKYTAKEDYEVMNDAPLDAVKSSTVFFWNLANELLKHIPRYLENRVVKAIQSKEISVADGDGIRASILLMVETLRELTK